MMLRETLHQLEKSRDELTEALEKEKELNDLKSRFVSMASHEFRTPLSTILSSVSLIDKYTLDEDLDKRQKHINRIKAQVKNLTNILEEFLSLGKQPETSTIPFIFLTAKTERTDIRKGMEMGADDYLTKPFDDIELLNAIESRFRKSEMIKKEFGNNAEGIAHFFDSASQLKLISDDRETASYKKKAFVYSEGHRPVYLYYLIKGKIKTFRTNEDGKELITGMYKEGDFFGYIPLLEESIYRDTAEALENAEVMLIPKTDFLIVV